MLFKYNNILKILDCSKSKMSNYLRYYKISDTMIENEELNLSLSLSLVKTSMIWIFCGYNNQKLSFQVFEEKKLIWYM